jgi:hypothetical protein
MKNVIGDGTLQTDPPPGPNPLLQTPSPEQVSHAAFAVFELVATIGVA